MRGSRLKTDIIQLLCYDDIPYIGSVLELVCWCFAALSASDMEIFVTCCWAIWNERNNFFHGCMSRHPAEVVASSISFLGAFQQAREGIGITEGIVRNRSEARWVPPDAPWIKVNVDGALFGEAGIGLGVVVRNHHGNVLRAT